MPTTTKYPMHKSEREIADADKIDAILSRAQYAVIAMCRDDEPYIVTLSCGYDRARRALYFHTAHQGLKLAFLARNARVCGTIVEDRGYIQGECAHAYRSVVFWGRMAEVDVLEEKKHGLEVLLDQLEDDPDIVRRSSLKEDSSYDRVNVLRLDIDEISGKQGR